MLELIILPIVFNMKKILIISSISASIILFSNISHAQQVGESMGEKIATIINFRGYLCAKVTDVQKLSEENTYRVTCIEYRNGNSKNTYTWDAGTNQVSER